MLLINPLHDAPSVPADELPPDAIMRPPYCPPICAAPVPPFVTMHHFGSNPFVAQKSPLSLSCKISSPLHHSYQGTHVRILMYTLLCLSHLSALSFHRSQFQLFPMDTIISTITNHSSQLDLNRSRGAIDTIRESCLPQISNHVIHLYASSLSPPCSIASPPLICRSLLNCAF